MFERLGKNALRMVQINKKYKIAFLFFCAVGFLYFIVFTAPFLAKKYIWVGDNYRMWSTEYFLFYSIKHFRSLPWWDPTYYCGYPFYFTFTAMTTNFFGIFHLPTLIAQYFFRFDINNYIVFIRTIYFFIINMVLFYAIMRNITKYTISSIVATLLFSFSYIQLANFHDYYIFQALSPAFLYILCLIYYEKKRTIYSFFIWIVGLSVFVSSFSNGVMVSAGIWCFLFTIFLFISSERMTKTTLWILKRFYTSRYSFWGAIICFLTLLFATSAAFSVVQSIANHFLRFYGGKFDLANITKFSMGFDSLTIGSIKSWTYIFSWIPFPDVHNKYLTFSDNVHQHWYIGILTLPLFFTSLVYGFKNKYVYIFFLSFAVCILFLVTSSNNILYEFFIDNFILIRGMRNFNTLFPRGGPLLFIIILSGIGFDYIVKRSEFDEAKGNKVYYIDFIWFFVLAVLFVTGFLLILLSVNSRVPDSLNHIGLYMVMFVLLITLLFVSKSKKVQKYIYISMLILIFTDLVISASGYVDNNLLLHPRPPDRFYTRAKVSSQYSPKGIPDNIKFSPYKADSKGLFGDYEMGYFYNATNVWFGIKEWLVLQHMDNKELWVFLKNWMPTKIRIKKYPSVSFYSNAFYIPENMLWDRRRYKIIAEKRPLFYLHEKLLILPGKIPEQIDVEYKINKFSPNIVSFFVNTKDSVYMMYADNYDKYWYATIDGVKTNIFRANFTFKSVLIPKGRHIIKFIYDPYPIKVGYGLFYLILLINVCFLIKWRKQINDKCFY